MRDSPSLDSSRGTTLIGGERRVLELIATGAPLDKTLDALCGVIDEQSGLISSVYLLDREGTRLSFMAGPQVPELWRQVTRSFDATPTAGACGAAVNRRGQVIVTDAVVSALYNDQWLEAARASGIAALWSTPLFAESGRVLGTFAVFSHESRGPTDFQLELVERATHLANIAVERHQTEEELRESERRMRTLSGRLMRAQDDERRRIAKLLHETTAQDLAALKMHLTRLARTEIGLSDGDRAALSESIELAEGSMAGIRTLSYLLHPPFLDEAGLLAALRWYTAGFAERSGIKVDLDLPATFERLPQEVETTLFRVVQEALINIHRHAGSQTASIRLRADGRQLTLEIADRGGGMPSEVMAQLPSGGGALGVGVAGMRERLQQLGGSLDIESTADGTTVRAQLPLPPTVP